MEGGDYPGASVIQSGLIIFSVSSRHMGLFERQIFISIHRQYSDIHFSERLADSEDSESYFAIGMIPHTMTSTRLVADAYHDTHTGRSWR